MRPPSLAHAFGWLHEYREDLALGFRWLALTDAALDEARRCGCNPIFSSGQGKPDQHIVEGHAPHRRADRNGFHGGGDVADSSGEEVRMFG